MADALVSGLLALAWKERLALPERVERWLLTPTGMALALLAALWLLVCRSPLVGMLFLAYLAQRTQLSPWAGQGEVSLEWLRAFAPSVRAGPRAGGLLHGLGLDWGDGGGWLGTGGGAGVRADAGAAGSVSGWREGRTLEEQMVAKWTAPTVPDNTPVTWRPVEADQSGASPLLAPNPLAQTEPDDASARQMLIGRSAGAQL